MASVLDRARRASGFPRWRSGWWFLGLVVVALVLAIVVVRPLVSGPGFVRRVTISNPSEFDVTVSVSPDHKQERMPLATVSHRSSVDLQDVIDQGSLWVFHFSADGHDGGDLYLPGDQLKREGWRVQIPDPVVARLRAEGAHPPPF